MRLVFERFPVESVTEPHAGVRAGAGHDRVARRS